MTYDSYTNNKRLHVGVMIILCCNTSAHLVTSVFVFQLFELVYSLLFLQSTHQGFLLHVCPAMVCIVSILSDLLLIQFEKFILGQ